MSASGKRLGKTTPLAEDAVTPLAFGSQACVPFVAGGVGRTNLESLRVARVVSGVGLGVEENVGYKGL
jgi:hypothetical protein